MTDAQTEARAIVAPWVHPFGITPGEEKEIVSAIAAALAAKNAELASRDMQLEASAKVALDLSAQLAEARKALEPFADVASEWDGEPGSLHVFLEWNDDGNPVPSLPVADFRAARRALEAQGGENVA